MKIIYTRKGDEIMVDDEDYEELNQFLWHVSEGYALTKYSNVNGRHYVRMHRVIMKTKKGDDTDHINHNKLDNQKKNLRVCTRAENMRNYSKNKSSTSGITGVSWDKFNNKWRSQIMFYGVMKNLGRYENINDAINARKAAEAIYFGEFAYTANL